MQAMQLRRIIQKKHAKNAKIATTAKKCNEGKE